MRKLPNASQKQMTKSMTECLDISNRVNPYCVYEGWLRTKTREIKRKYCLAHRQGAIGIETTEIKKNVLAGDPEQKSGKKDQVRSCADRNLSLSKRYIAAWEN